MRVYVSSIDRPDYVPRMEALAGDAELVWCVPPTVEAEYRAAGARTILLGPPGQVDKQNAVLDEFGHDWVVFSDDDCRSLWIGKQDDARRTTFGEAARLLVEIGQAEGARAVCYSGQRNLAWARYSVSYWGRFTGQFMAVAPGVRERLDPTTTPAHDWDFGAKILSRYGRFARVNWLSAEYEVATSTGLGDGADRWLRTAAANEILLERYPEIFARHKTIPGEIVWRRVRP